MKTMRWLGPLCGLALAAGLPTAAAEQGQPVLVEVKRLSLDTARSIAEATLARCREEGVQVAVTVVDRSGVPQVILRDVLAVPLTLEISRQKATTAMSYNTPTSALAGQFTQPFSVAKVDGVLPSAGGLPINAGGAILGGVGVSGAPSGKLDEDCAQAGIDAVQMDLEMEAL